MGHLKPMGRMICVLEIVIYELFSILLFRPFGLLAPKTKKKKLMKVILETKFDINVFITAYLLLLHNS